MFRGEQPPGGGDLGRPPGLGHVRGTLFAGGRLALAIAFVPLASVANEQTAIRPKTYPYR
jgi:hypothetical protein